MFTGIIHGLGKVENILKIKGRGRAAELIVDLGKLSNGLKVGYSVCVNGACLTVVKIRKNKVSFEMIGETMKKTSLGSLAPGDVVNIERSLKIGDTMDGHFVLGHIDGVGKIIEKAKRKDQMNLWISTDKKLLKHIVPKGSIAIDGVSLTVIDVKSNRFSVALIPHTIVVTTLGTKKRGDKVNIEIDVLARYIRRVLTGKD
ncbi:MAG: riboflavin synthase [Nitrososphaerales archaeon]